LIGTEIVEITQNGFSRRVAVSEFASIVQPPSSAALVLELSDLPDLVDTSVALNVGAANPAISLHTEFGPGHIQAKNNATNAGQLILNTLGGDVEIGAQSGLGDVQLFDDGLAAARTVAPLSGGLEINNLVTGVGFERVLTTADIGGVADPLTIGRIIITDTNSPDLADTVVALNIGAADPTTSQHIEVGPNSIQSKTNATTAGLLNIAPFGASVNIGAQSGTGGVSLWFDGQIVFETNDRGVFVFGLDDGDPTVPNAITSLIDIESRDAEEYALIGFNGTIDLQFDSKVWGGDVLLKGTTAAGVNRNLLRGDPDADVALYNAGVIVAQTLAAASGGLQANNTLTGAGLERVLTASDLGGGGTLAGLSDVTITAPADGAMFRFDNGSGDWINDDRIVFLTDALAPKLDIDSTGDTNGAGMRFIKTDSQTVNWEFYLNAVSPGTNRRHTIRFTAAEELAFLDQNSLQWLTKGPLNTDFPVFGTKVVFPVGTTSRASLRIPVTGTAPSAGEEGDVWVTQGLAKGVHIRIQSVNYEIPLLENTLGKTWTAKQTFPASTTSESSIGLPHGVAPSAPVNGDVWTTTTGYFARINGVTINLTAASSTLGGLSDVDLTGAATGDLLYDNAGTWEDTGGKLSWSGADLLINALANVTSFLTIGEATTTRGGGQDSRMRLYGEQSSTITQADFTYDGVKLVINVTGSGNIEIPVRTQFGDEVVFAEKPAAGIAVATFGAVWVRNDTPNTLMFTRDDDTDVEITPPASAAYTRNATVVEDRTLLASASATATNNNNVLAALLADLQAIGILG